MALFRPNTTCMLRRPESRNVFNESVLGTARVVPCALIKLPVMVEKTSVRADSSSSRGAAQERVIEGKLLFLPEAGVKHGDQIEIVGQLLRVSGHQTRVSLDGKIDHIEIYVVAWGESE